MFILSGAHRPRNTNTEYDPFASYVVSLLRGSDDFIDETGNTWSTVEGTPVISTAVGNPAGAVGGAMYFNGLSSIGTAHQSKFNINGVASCIEFWLNTPNNAGLPQRSVVYKAGYQSAGGGSFLEGPTPRGNSSTGWRIQYYNGLMNRQIFGNGDNLFGTFSNNTWTHFAFVFTGAPTGTRQVSYLNGVAVGVGNNPVGNLDQAISLMIGGPAANNIKMTGYVYGFRWTVGVQRYTGNFTPLTSWPRIT